MAVCSPLVGHPLDTVKSKMQAQASYLQGSATRTIINVVKNEGFFAVRVHCSLACHPKPARARAAWWACERGKRSVHTDRPLVAASSSSSPAHLPVPLATAARARAHVRAQSGATAHLWPPPLRCFRSVWCGAAVLFAHTQRFRDVWTRARLPAV
ncbi:hypothetical protein EON67_01885 [archaeon]|nr:MAG: hypothetical protein EON67_01885 [archaeon]